MLKNKEFEKRKESMSLLTHIIRPRRIVENCYTYIQRWSKRKNESSSNKCSTKLKSRKASFHQWKPTKSVFFKMENWNSATFLRSGQFYIQLKPLVIESFHRLIFNILSLITNFLKSKQFCIRLNSLEIECFHRHTFKTFSSYQFSSSDILMLDGSKIMGQTSHDEFIRRSRSKFVVLKIERNSILLCKD